MRKLNPAERAVWKDTAWLNFITDSIPALIAYIDSERCYRFNNEAFKDWYGRSPTELYGKHVREVLGEPAYEILKEHIEKALSGERVTFETKLSYKNGVMRNIHATYVPDFDEAGKVRGFVAFVNDITEKRHAEEALREGAERLTQALQFAYLGDWSWEAATDMVTLSERAAEIFGVPPGPHITLTEMRELLHEEDRERARLEFKRAIDEHGDYDIEYRVIQPSGKHLWVADKGRAVYDDLGQVKGMLGIVQDITEYKAVKTQLEEEGEILETVNRLGQMLSAELDLKKLVQALTDAATEIISAKYGSFFYNVQDENGGCYRLYTLSGAPSEHFAHFPMPRVTELLGHTFRGESVLRIDDVKNDPRYGKNMPYYGLPPHHLMITSYLAVPVISRSGENLGMLLFGHPEPGVFTERHERIIIGLAGQAAIAMDNARLYEATLKARQEAEKANRLKDEFLATVSHELRTPLNAILGWARMLHIGKLDEASAARAIETIERNAKAQQQIIEDILEVSRIITGKLRLDVSPVEIAPAIEAAVDALRPTAEAKGVKLLVVLDSNHNLVLGDTNRLQQIVWNLLSNAIKFTHRGGRVQVALERIDSHVKITVSDTGRGIGGEFLPYVFDRFRQADSSTARTHSGLGLGLAIVRHLVELHGGTVTATSPGENMGATFIVNIPLAVMYEGASLFDPDLTPDLFQTATGVVPEEYGLKLTGVRVLVVDDEADARELLTVVLQQCGADVKVAGSTRETLSIMEEWRPDVLVSDIGMPGEDGYALIRRVRALPLDRGGNIPAAALTAYARSEDRLKAIAAGYQTHIAKPVEPPELAAVVASLAGKAGR